MNTYVMINPKGQETGVQTLTDTMADRLTDRGWNLIPTENVPAIKVTFGPTFTRTPQHA